MTATVTLHQDGAISVESQKSKTAGGIGVATLQAAVRMSSPWGWADARGSGRG